jgi:hypothetical protein
MGVRRLLGAGRLWVARAGVDVRARRTGVRFRAVFEVLATTRDVFLLAAFLLAAFLLAAFLLAAFLVAVFLVPWVFLFVGRFEALRVDDRAAVLRRVERSDPFVFFRDAAAFNCFPLIGLWAPALEQDAQELPGSAFLGIILAEGLTPNPTLFIGPIQKCGQGFGLALTH